jgi:hypothetical protein
MGLFIAGSTQCTRDREKVKFSRCYTLTMSTEHSWFKNLEEARRKAQQVAHLEKTRDSITVPASYNPGIFIYFALIGVEDAWRVHMESVKSGDTEQVIKIMLDPLSKEQGRHGGHKVLSAA